MSKIYMIAVNTFREAVRDKILYNLGIFALGLILFSLLLGDWSVFARETVIKDFTLAVMSISGLLMSVFVGIGLLQKEIQKKTILALAAKPIPRWHLIIGKYLGLLAVLGINLVIMTLFFFGMLWVIDANPEPGLIKAVYLIYVEMAVIVAAAVLFSSFSTPFLSALFTLGFYIAGHLSGSVMAHLEFMNKFGDKVPGVFEMSPWMAKGARIIYYIIPNLENFNIKGQVVYNLELAPHFITLSSLYGLLYIFILLTITCLWFNRRDFH